MRKCGFVPSNHLPAGCKNMQGWANPNLLMWGPPVRVNTSHTEKMTEALLISLITKQTVYLTKIELRRKTEHLFFCFS